MLDQVEEGLLPPVHVVEDADERPLGGDRLEQLAEGPGDLLARGDQLLVAEKSTDRLRRGCIRLDCRELLDDLHDRPVGDALAVGQAAPADDECVERAEELGRQAGLADPGGPEDREQLAGTVA